jgi:hypothetical protein
VNDGEEVPFMGIEVPCILQEILNIKMEVPNFQVFGRRGKQLQ